MSDIQDHVNNIIKKHEASTTDPSINAYINKINNRILFKIKDENKLELQMSEIMKLLGSTK